MKKTTLIVSDVFKHDDISQRMCAFSSILKEHLSSQDEAGSHFPPTGEVD